MIRDVTILVHVSALNAVLALSSETFTAAELSRSNKIFSVDHEAVQFPARAITHKITCAIYETLSFEIQGCVAERPDPGLVAKTGKKLVKRWVLGRRERLHPGRAIDVSDFT